MKTLVIGYGNPVRSDDGAGIVAAQEIEKLNLPDVQVWTLQQLHVDLAEDFSDFDRIVFVDAAETGGEVELTRLEPSQTAVLSSSHFLGPEVLGSLAKKIYGISPELFTCAIRGENFGFGDTLSADCRGRVSSAVKAILKLLKEVRCA